MEMCQNGTSSRACSPRARVDLPELDAPLSRMILPGEAGSTGTTSIKNEVSMSRIV